MSLILRVTFVSITALVVFSCSNQKADAVMNENFSFSLEIVDSIQIDFLGDIDLIDYDSKSDKYLLATDYTEEYLEVDKKGEILTHKKFNSDTKDAAGFILGSGYLDGEVVVLSETKGFLMYQNGNKTGELSLPYMYIPYLNYPKLGVFKYENRLYYPKPMQESIYSLTQEGGKFYSAIYHMPMIEGQNLSSGDTISALRLPETSEILDGQMHGMLFPVFSQTEKHVLLSTWVEPKIYVYNKMGGNITYDKTIEIAIPDWVAYTPTALEDRDGFYRHNNKRMNGGLVDILELEEYYVAVYYRGIEESKMPEKVEDQDEYNLAIKMKNSCFAAIFDKEFNQLAVNVPFPATSSIPRVVNTDGELVVSKDASLSETEDDGVILYKLKLTKEQR